MRSLASFLVTALAACGSVQSGGGGPADLDYLTVSDAVMGQAGRLRINLTNPAVKDVSLALSSATPAVATLPDHATVPAGATSVEVPFMGVAPGSALFVVTKDTELLTTTTSVVDMLRVNNPSSQTLEVGAHSVVYQGINMSVPAPVTVMLDSSQPSIATIDPMVTIPEFSSSGYAQLTAVAPGATVITASLSGQTAQNTVVVVDKAHIANIYGTTLYEAGGHGTIQISLTAQVAAATPLTIAASSGSVVTVPTTVTIPTGSDFAQVRVDAAGAGQTNLMFTLNGAVSTLPITVLAKAQLENVSLSGSPAIGAASQLTASMDVQVATAHDVTLTSSNPSVLAVPPTITIAAGTSSTTVSVTPVAAGDAIVTASFNGITRTSAVHVGTTAYSLNLYGPSNLVVGTTGTLSVNTGSPYATTVSLSSSNPSVVSVPPTLVVGGYSDSVTMTPQGAGTATITASANGVTQQFPVSVLAKASIVYFGPQYNLPTSSMTNAYVQFDAAPPAGTQITFTTSNASVVPAPASVTVTADNTYIPFSLATGATSGTATITASANGTSASAIVYVGGSTATGVFNAVYEYDSTLEVGAGTTLYTYFSPATTSPDTGAITYSVNGIVSTPSTTIPIVAGNCCSYFPVTATAAGTTDVIVTVSGIQQSATMTVVANATYSLSVPSSVKAGSSVSAHIYANAVVAANRTFALQSSATGTAQVLSSSTTLGPGTTSATFGIKGVAAGTATITATMGATVLTANITVTP